MADNIACPQCGTSVSPNTRFCPECGYPIQAEFYQSSRPTPSGVVPATQKMDDTPDFAPYSPPIPEGYGAEPAPRRSPRTLYLLGGGLAVLACCAIAGIFMVFSALSGDGSFSISLFASDTPTPSATPTQTATPTLTPTPPPTNTPVPSSTLPPPPVSDSGLPLTGNQRLTDFDFFDDFSSDALDWAVSSDESSQVGYEGNAYMITIFASDYLHLVRPPLENLTHLEFFANVASGGDNGSFGVACFFEDIDNFAYVAFDGASQNLRFAQYVNDEWSALTDWTRHSVPLQSIKVAVDCSSTTMVAYLNGTHVGQVQISRPNGPFTMWLMATTWDEATGPIKVFFDDVSGTYTP